MKLPSFFKRRKAIDDYVDIIKERYPWASDDAISKSAEVLRNGVVEMDNFCISTGTMTIDWDSLDALGAKVASIIGPAPTVALPE